MVTRTDAVLYSPCLLFLHDHDKTPMQISLALLCTLRNDSHYLLNYQYLTVEREKAIAVGPGYLIPYTMSISG